MFSVAILIGIYSYVIFALGLLGLLYKQDIVFITLFFLSSILIWKKNQILGYFIFLISFKKNRLNYFSRVIKKNKLAVLLIFLLLVQMIINLTGTLGPEFAFDALWYHLTLPKLYLINHSISYIPGGLLYYSAMPKLAEMLYTASLFFGSEVLAKLIHFSFGILSLIVLYILSRKILNKKFSILVVVIFYSNLVVDWQSITAYIDLARTFFEIMALWGFINFWEKGEKRWLIESAIVLGLAITTKLLAIGSLFIFILLIAYKHFLEKNKELKALVTSILAYLCFALLIPFPWFVFSYIHTGNPVFPFFSHTYPIGLSLNLFNPLNFIKDMWVLFTGLADPISPLYIIFLPLIIIYFRKFSRLLKVISIYSFLAIIVWYFTPRTGGGRFILPYLPAFSIVVAGTINELKKTKYFYKFSIILAIAAFLFSISYRAIANVKYLPVIFGKESKGRFLASHLNFSFGDFYDTDGYLKKNIKSKDRVLLYGFHNLYYVDFPFVDSSWVKKGDIFNYIATQNTSLPSRFSYWPLVYINQKTHVKLYSLGGQKWAY